jgi:hypothetical protein
MNAFNNVHDPMLGTRDADIDNNDSQQDHDKARYFHGFPTITERAARPTRIIATTPKTQKPAAIQNPIFTWDAALLAMIYAP